MRTMKKCLTILMLGFVLVGAARAAYLRNVPQVLKQPDGTIVRCFASGDEFYNWLHDENDFTIVRHPISGYLVYATESNGKLVASKYVVGRVNPAEVSLQPNLRISKQEYLKKRVIFHEEVEPASAPTTGTINSICIFIRFSDQNEFPNARSTYDPMFNSSTAGFNSQRNYYDEVSYGQLTISTTFYPDCAATTNLSYQDLQPRDYYRPFDPFTNPIGYDPNDKEERKAREDFLLVNAVGRVSSEIPTDLDIDSDDDGEVDHVCFIIRGQPQGGDPNNILWPHHWTLSKHDVYINGKKVYHYTFLMDDGLNVGTSCHEMFHNLGAPDLYHRPQDGLEPVGRWDIMEQDLNPPQHMGAYMKSRYGNWISSLPRISNAGTYTLLPLSVRSISPKAYRFNSPVSSFEYYVMECRHQTGTFESSLPGSGLLVYRINTIYDGQGNRDGPPDEVYIYRPGGTTTTNGMPGLAHFSADVGRTCINDDTNPSGFLSDGRQGGLFIADISSAGDYISFYIGIPTELEGSIHDIYPGPLISSHNPYWVVGNVTTPSSMMLSIANGTVVYFNSGLKFTAQGTINCTSGGQWTNLFALSGYRRGIKCKGQIRMTNGGEIKLY